MNLTPLVTVYIPCRNYGRFLEKSVESVYKQLYTNWEVIIVDEASEDGSLEIAKALCRKYPEKTRLIQNKNPVGLQKLANDILALAKGKYMVRLDADDWFDECALLLMVAKLEATPNVGLVYGNYFYTDPNGCVLGIERRHKLGEEDLVGQLPPHGACTMFRTRALKVVGGYSEDINAQDGWELWYKLYNRVGAVNLDVPLFYYRQHGNSLSRDSNRLLSARSKIFERMSESLNGDFKLINIAVIPVRESYKDFEGVPYRIFEGSSLLERVINVAACSDKIDCVIVSSQSQNVLDYSLELEKEGKVPKHLRLLRNEEEEGDKNIPIRELMINAGEHYANVHGVYPDAVSFLSLHAVYRKTEHIEKALNVLRVTECDSVVSVQEEREPMFGYGETGLKLLNPGRFQDLVYDRERLFQFNGSIIATWWDVLKENNLFGDKIGFVEMSAKESLQINNPAMLHLRINDNF